MSTAKVLQMPRAPYVAHELEPGYAPEVPPRPWLHPVQMALARKVLKNEALRFCAKHDRENLVGRTFGRLKVLRKAGRQASGRRPAGVQAWFCRCRCGKTCAVAGNNLQTGGTRSCGCLHRERARAQALLNALGRRKAGR